VPEVSGASSVDLNKLWELPKRPPGVAGWSENSNRLPGGFLTWTGAERFSPFQEGERKGSPLSFRSFKKPAGAKTASSCPRTRPAVPGYGPFRPVLRTIVTYEFHPKLARQAGERHARICPTCPRPRIGGSCRFTCRLSALSQSARPSGSRSR